MSERVRLEGGMDLQKTLEQLPGKVNRKLLIAAGRKAGRILVKVARRKAPRKTGNLRKSIGIRTGKRKDTASVLVGPRLKGKYKGWYAHFVEFGVSGIGRFKKRRKSGDFQKVTGSRFVYRYRSDISAKPFMRPAYDQTKDQIFEEYGSHVGTVTQKYLDKQAAKMNTKAKK